MSWRFESFRHSLARKGIETGRKCPYRTYKDGNLAIAGERFEFSHLKKLGEGSDRVVFELPDKKVLKVATTARGIAQNEIEGTKKFSVPKIEERGQDYVVVKEMPKQNIKQIKEKLKPLQEFSSEDLDNNNPKLMRALKKLGIKDLTKFQVAWGDITKPSSWTLKDGKLQLIDAGALTSESATKHYRFDASHPKYVDEWKKVLAHRNIITKIRRGSYAAKESVGKENVIGIAFPFPHKESQKKIAKEEKAWIDEARDGSGKDMVIDGLKISSDTEAGTLNEGFKDLLAFASGEYAANFLKKAKVR